MVTHLSGVLPARHWTHIWPLNSVCPSESLLVAYSCRCVPNPPRGLSGPLLRSRSSLSVSRLCPREYLLPQFTISLSYWGHQPGTPVVLTTPVFLDSLQFHVKVLCCCCPQGLHEILPVQPPFCLGQAARVHLPPAPTLPETAHQLASLELCSWKVPRLSVQRAQQWTCFSWAEHLTLICTFEVLITPFLKPQVLSLEVWNCGFLLPQPSAHHGKHRKYL